MMKKELKMEELELVNGGRNLKFDNQLELDFMVYALWGYEKIKKYLSND